MVEVDTNLKWTDLKRVLDKESAFSTDFEAGGGDELIESL